MINDRLVYRHRLWVRLTHWINVVCMTVLLMSGLQIFNAHPALYWGNTSNFDHPLLAIAGFPDWVTLPGTQWLSMGRRWHFFFAWLFVVNGMAYALLAVFRGHLRDDLLPSGRDLRGIGHSIRQHLRLRFPKGAEAKHYNVLQKLTYLVVLVILCPLIVLAGLAMSPQLDAGYPWLPWLFGGRQSARHDPLRLRLLTPRLCRSPPGDGRALGSLEQHPVDDHRLVRHRGRAWLI